jgi:hypothetical protein
VLLAILLFALVGWALAPLLMLALLIAATAWYGWKRWLNGAADRELRRYARAWAKARRARERWQAEPL